MQLDKERTAEVAMALLALTMFQDGSVSRAWKGMDWDVLDDLYQRGWICDPKGKVKSVVFTEKGRELALDFMGRHLGVAALQDDATDSPAGGD
jgi:hypothetical protein